MKRIWVCLLFFSFILLAQESKNITIENVKLSPEFSVSSEKDRGWACITGEVITNMNWEASDIEILANMSTYGAIYYSVPMHIPASSRKRFYLYISLKSIYRDIEVSIKKNNQILKQENIQLPYNYKTLLRVGYFPPQKDHNLYFLKKIEKYTPWISQTYYSKTLEEIEVVNLEPRILPDRWIGYQNMDLMIISKEELLSEDKKKAIREWVYNGGVLMISPQERAWTSGSNFVQSLLGYDISPEDISYFRIPEDVEKFLPGTTRFIALKAPADAIKDKELKDSLWYVHRGAGAIFYVGMDVGKENAGSSIFWKLHLLPKLYNVLTRRNSWYFLAKREDHREESRLTSALNLSFDRMPGIWTILILLTLYLLLAGPINFWYFRRKNLTLHLVWSIPCLSLLFTIIFLIYGYWVRGMESETFSFHIVQPVEGTDYVCHQKYLSLLSSSHSIYDIHLQKDGTLEPLYSNWRARDNAVLNYNQRQGLILQDYPLSLWQTGIFYSVYFQENLPFSIKHSKNSINIKKPSSISLKNIFAFLNKSDLYYLGDFEKKETQREFFLNNSTATHNQMIQQYWKFSNNNLAAIIKETLQQEGGSIVVIAIMEGDISSPVSLQPGPDKTKEINLFYYK